MFRRNIGNDGGKSKFKKCKSCDEPSLVWKWYDLTLIRICK